MSSTILSEARRIGPSIAARSAEIERCGTLPLDIVAAMRPSQAFRQWVPADLGGPEQSPWQGLEVIEEYGYHDGSAGWSVAIASTSSLMASYLPERWAQQIFADTESITGGFAAPAGKAHPVEGGLRVTGTWQWGSGTNHCTWIGGGCVVVGDDDKPARRADGLAYPFVFFDRGDVEFLDTWHVAGLEGTGSHDYRVADAFVPEGRWVQIGFDAPVRDVALSRFSFYGLLALSVAATSVGIARRSIDELVDLAQSKQPQGSSRPLRDRAPIQADVARAEARVASSWGFMADAVGSAWETALSGVQPSDEQRGVLRLAATYATEAAAEVTLSMYTAAGGAAVYRTSPIQRCFRDTHVATQHAMVAPRMFEALGRMRLGLETDTRMF